MPLEPLKEHYSLFEKIWRWCRAATFTAVGMSALISINILQTLSLPLKMVAPAAFRRFNRKCAGLWWGWCVTFSRKFNRTRFIVTGADLPEAENAIVVVNHQDMPDIVAIMSLARSKSSLGDLKFFVKKAIKWFPGIGWGMQFIDCVFINRNWASDREHIRKTFSHLVENNIPLWLVSFVEGTRSTRGKIDQGRRFAQERGLTLTRHLLPPRSKGFVATVQGLGDHVHAVYDVTIGYCDGVPNLWQFIKGSVRQVHMHARRYPIEEFPRLENDLRQWLLDRFVEKDELLEHFYTHGVFPSETLPPEMAVVPAAATRNR